jgi:prepilin-type N-terminal cleavage/methylation domain-containing protein
MAFAFDRAERHVSVRRQSASLANVAGSSDNRKGFTLVELIVVLVILAILAAILVPTLLGYINQANSQKDYSTCAELQQAAQAAVIEQKHNHPERSYQELNPIRSGDNFSVDKRNGGMGEKQYVCYAAGVDESRVDWLYFNVDPKGKVTSTYQTASLNGRTIAEFPTSVCLDGHIYYMTQDGQWTASDSNDTKTFKNEAGRSFTFK